MYKSWDRTDVSKPLVPRAEAEQALRKAAELAHPDAMLTLAVLLDRGGVVKRDPADARFGPSDRSRNHRRTGGQPISRC
jgi:TPR repeat protein